jgi:DNA-binding MarR family transcriptional regulator
LKSYYIVKPHFVGITEKKLRYVDVLTYLAIRYYYNYEDRNCFPAYETIAGKIGMSRAFVMDSTDRLVKAGYINKQRRLDKSNLYTFKGATIVDKIPVEVLALHLSIYEKAMLVLLRQCCEGTDTDILISMTNIAARLGISYKVVNAQMHSLLDQGYVEEKINRNTKRVIGYKLTSLVDWSYDTDYKPNPDGKASGVLLIT